MNADIAVFIFIFVFIGVITWVGILRRVKFLPVQQLFEPATFNLIIFVFTSLIGVATIYTFHEHVYFNKVVDSYANNRSTNIALWLSLQIFLCVAFVARMNWCDLRNNFKSEKLTINHVDTLYLLIMCAMVLFFASKEFVYLTRALSAVNQYEVMQHRKMASEAGSIYLFKKVLLEGVFWISAIYYAYVRPKKLLPNLLLLVLVVAYVIYFMATLKKIQFVFFIISVAGARYYNSRISLVGVLVIAISFISLMFIIYWFLIKNTDLLYMLSPFNEGLLGRVFISEISSLYAHIELFQNASDRIGFSSLSNMISSIAGMDKSARSGEIVMATVNPHWVEMEIGGTYNTIFVGEAYANFGLVGSLLSVFFVAIYYRTMFYVVVKFFRNLKVPLLIYISLNVSMMSGFNDFLYDPFLILILSIIFFYQSTKQLLT